MQGLKEKGEGLMLLGVWELLHMSLVGKAFCPIDCMIKNEIAYSVSFMK